MKVSELRKKIIESQKEIQNILIELYESTELIPKNIETEITKSFDMKFDMNDSDLPKTVIKPIVKINIENPF